MEKMGHARVLSARLPHGVTSSHHRPRRVSRARIARSSWRAASSAEPPPVDVQKKLATPPQLPPELVAKSTILRTVAGEPVRMFGLGGNRNVRQPRELAAAARAAGVNYFFAYSMNDHEIGDYLDGLADLCADPVQRKKIFITCGTMNFHDSDAITAHVERCLNRLGTDYLDAFFLEYVQCGEEETALDAIRWMRKQGGLVVEKGGRCGIDGPVRYVGCTTHNRCVATRLLRSERIIGGGGGGGGDEVGERRRDVQSRVDAVGDDDMGEEGGEGKGSDTGGDGDGGGGGGGEGDGGDVDDDNMQHRESRSTNDDDDDGHSLGPCEMDLLMVRYNMAHVKAEKTVFPLAVLREVPIVAFTSTRWNSLQKGHPDWQESPPAVADCMRFAAHPKAVGLVLNSPHNVDQLDAWVRGIAEAGGEGMTAAEVKRWREYGKMVYDEGAAFESS